MTPEERARKALTAWRVGVPSDDPLLTDVTEAIRQAIAAAYEDAARWHDDQQQGGHCGEDTTEKIVRQRRNKWHEEAAAAIRARANTEAG